MYAWIFRHLPGPLWLRIVEAAVLIVALFFVLMLWVFPWVNDWLNLNDATLDGAWGAAQIYFGS